MHESHSSRPGTPGGQPSAGSGAAPVVTVAGGRVSGLVVPGGYVFRGLPYAAPPTGDLRWRAPRPPAGLAAWFYEKFVEWTDTDGEPERVLTKDDMLDDITLYWLTNTAASSARIYWEDSAHKAKVGGEVSIPAAVSRFPKEIIPLPRSWAERAYPNLVYFNELEKGGHFAAWEQPQLLSEELRAAFRTLR